MKFQPTRDRVLVRRVAEKTETEGGIVIPDQAVEKPQEGTVVSVALPYTVDDVLVKPQFKVDQNILFSKYAGTEIELDDETFIIINQYDVLGVLTDE